MRCLVTGGNGFIGSHLIEYLLQEGNEVIAVVRRNSDHRRLEGMDVTFTYGDCTNRASLLGALERVERLDYVFHLAGTDRVTRSEDYYNVNCGGTANMIRTCDELCPTVKKFVYVSSIFATGPNTPGGLLREDIPARPMTQYGKSKLLAEQEVLRYKDRFPIAVIRPAAIYGPGDRNMFALVRLLSKGIAPYFGDEDRKFSLCYVKDLIAGIFLAAQKTEVASGEVFLLADSKAYTIIEIMRAFADALGVKPRYVKAPLGIVKPASFLAGAFCNLLNRPTIFTLEKTMERIEDWACDIAKARRYLGFEPKYDLQSGAQQTVEWYKTNGWL